MAQRVTQPSSCGHSGDQMEGLLVGPGCPPFVEAGGGASQLSRKSRGTRGQSWTPPWVEWLHLVSPQLPGDKRAGIAATPSL